MQKDAFILMGFTHCWPDVRVEFNREVQSRYLEGTSCWPAKMDPWSFGTGALESVETDPV